MDRKEWEYRNEVAEYNANRGEGREARDVSPTLIREAREAMFLYWVHGKRREYLAGATSVDGKLQSSGVIVLEKDATYDPQKDQDMRDAVRIEVDDPDSRWRP